MQAPLCAAAPLVRAALAGCALAAGAAAFGQAVEPAAAPAGGLTPLPAAVSGRVETRPGGVLVRQWPGTYFETAFTGAQAYFRVGGGDVSLRIAVDGQPPMALVKLAPGLYLSLIHI